MRRGVPTGATTGAYLLPLGKGTSYAGFEMLNPTMGAASVVAGEFFETGNGSNFGAQMSSLNAGGYYWNTSLSPAHLPAQG